MTSLSYESVGQRCHQGDHDPVVLATGVLRRDREQVGAEGRCRDLKVCREVLPDVVPPGVTDEAEPRSLVLHLFAYLARRHREGPCCRPDYELGVGLAANVEDGRRYVDDGRARFRAVDLY